MLPLLFLHCPLTEAELLRKIRIQMRAMDMLKMASSPISTSSSQTPRTAARTQEEKLSFLQTEFGFQPRVNPVVPDYEGLYKAFQRRAAKRRETRETTRNKPFLLRTASLCHTPRPCDAATAEGGRKRTQVGGGEGQGPRPDMQWSRPRSQRKALALTFFFFCFDHLLSCTQIHILFFF